MRTKLDELKDDERFAPYLKKGAQADVSYQQWGKLRPTEKASKFRRLVKAMGALLVVLGAADTASAAFGPVLALGEPEAAQDYRTALEALQQGRYDEAERALFGSGDPADIFEANPRGLIPKMLSRMYHANPGNSHALIELYRQMKLRFNALAREAPGATAGSFGPAVSSFVASQEHC